MFSHFDSKDGHPLPLLCSLNCLQCVFFLSMDRLLLIFFNRTSSKSPYNCPSSNGILIQLQPIFPHSGIYFKRGKWNFFPILQSSNHAVLFCKIFSLTLSSKYQDLTSRLCVTLLFISASSFESGFFEAALSLQLFVVYTFTLF